MVYHSVLRSRNVFRIYCRPEFEKLSGSEMMETCYLVNELFIGPEDEN